MNVRKFFALGLLVLALCSTKTFGEETSSKEDVNKQLIAAVEKGDEKAVEQLLKQGADPNTKYKYDDGIGYRERVHYGRSSNSWSGVVLHLAIEKKNLNVVKQLIKNGADVNSPCSRCCEFGIDYWASRSVTGITPLMIAIEKEQWDIVSYLIQSGADINKSSEACLHGYSKFGSSSYKSVLDYALSENAPESIIDLLKSKGALTYKEIEEERETKERK